MAKHFGTSVSRGAFARAWRYLVPLALALHGCTVPTFVEAGPDAELEEDEDGGVVTQARDAATPTQPGDPDEPDVDAARPLSDGGNVAATGDAAAIDSGMPASDAGNLPMTMVDADVSPALPAWAMPLIGTYAKRSVTFSWDDQPGGTAYNTQNVELSIVKITQDGSELKLSVQLCDYRISLLDPNYPPLVFSNAAATPPMSGHILLGAPNTFSSTEMVQHLGFDPTPARTMCTGGRHDKFPGQTWISGSSCACYGTQVPVNLDDCRVTDGDGDGRAGTTWRGQAASFTSGLQDYLMVFDYAVTMLDGQVATDGRHTLREQRAQTAACIVQNGCDVGHNTLCPDKGSTKLIKHTGSSPLTCASLNGGDFGPIDPWPTTVDCRAK